MIIRNQMRFMAADDAGGGTAVAEPPEVHAEAPVTPLGDIFEREMAKSRGEPPTKPEIVKVEPKPLTKSASALDAVLEPVIEEKKEVPESALKDLPETLPRESRGEHWTRARAAIERHETTIGQQAKTIADQAKQIETAKTAPPETVQELVTLKKTLDGYKDAIVAANIELLPEFRGKYIDGRNELVSETTGKMKSYGGNVDLLTDALSMPEGKHRTQIIREAMGEEMDEMGRIKILDLINQIDKLDAEKVRELKNAQGSWETYQRKQAVEEQSKNEQTEAYKKTVFDKTLLELPKDLPLLKTVDSSFADAADHNSRAQKIRDAAWKLLGAETAPEMIVETALRAEVQREEHPLWMSDRQELAKARASLKEYQESEPGFSGGKPPKPDEKEKPAEERYFNALEKMQGGEN